MSRVVSIGMSFSADLAAAETAYQRFVKTVTTTPLTVPLTASGSAAAVSTPTATLGGLSVPTSAGLYGRGGNGASASLPNFDAEANQLRGGMTTLARAMYAQASVMRDKTNGVRGLTATANTTDAEPGHPSSDVGGGASRRGAFSRLYTRLGRAGGFYIAYRGIEALGREYGRRQELDDALQYEGPAEAARVAAAQTRQDRSNLVESGIRTAFVKTLRFFGASKDVAQTDTEKFQQDLVNQAIIEGSTTASKFRTLTVGLRRRAGLAGLDPLTARAAEANIGLAETEDTTRLARNRANEIAAISPDAAKEIRTAANENYRAAELVNRGILRSIGVEREAQVHEIGADIDAANLRAGNRPIAAARRLLQNDLDARVFQARVTNDPLLPFLESYAAAKSDEFNAQAARAPRLAAQGLRGQNQADILRLNRQPLQAEIKSFVSERESEFRKLGNEPENDPLREAISESINIGVSNIRKFDKNRDTLQNLRFDTRDAEIKELLRRNPGGAQAAGIAGGALENAEVYLQDGKRGLARRALQSGIGQLQALRQHDLDQFRGEAVDLRHFDTSNPREQDQAVKQLEAVNKNLEVLQTKIDALGSD